MGGAWDPFDAYLQCEERAYTRREVRELLGDNYQRAWALAVEALGQENFTDWREASYDTPALNELLEAAIDFGGLSWVAEQLEADDGE